MKHFKIFSIPFSMEEIFRSFDGISLSDVDPPQLLRQRRWLQFSIANYGYSLIVTQNRWWFLYYRDKIWLCERSKMWFFVSISIFSWIWKLKFYHFYLYNMTIYCLSNYRIQMVFSLSENLKNRPSIHCLTNFTSKAKLYLVIKCDTSN